MALSGPETLKHPGYTPGYPTCKEGYPNYDYYSAFPYRCTQDPISFHISCIRRNFVGPDYGDSSYIGRNTLDPANL